MQQRRRIVLAAGVLLLGVVVAMLFRHPQAPNPRSPEPSADPLLLLRKEVGSQTEGAPAERPTVRIESPLTRRNEPAPPPTILLPMDPGQPPPELARTYPGSAATPAVGWDGSVALGTQSASAARAIRKHKVVDGDTLTALAQRYLGSADRSAEIFEANKDILARPDLLPIGVELKIPSSAPAPVPGSASTPQRPLMPVPQGRPSVGGI